MFEFLMVNPTAPPPQVNPNHVNSIPTPTAPPPPPFIVTPTPTLPKPPCVVNWNSTHW